MAGLSRRGFIGAVGSLAAVWSIAPDVLGRRLVAAAAPSDVLTTLAQTIRMTAPVRGQYRNLAIAPGEPYAERLDLIGRRADPGRAARRRSLVYIGHFSDIHIMDPSPRPASIRWRGRTRVCGPG